MDTEQLSKFLSQQADFYNDIEETIDTQEPKDNIQDTDNFNTDEFLNDQVDDTTSNQKNNVPQVSPNDGYNGIDRSLASASKEICTSPNGISSHTPSTFGDVYTVFTPEGADFDSDLFEKLSVIDPINAGFLYQFFVKFNINHLQIQYLKDFHIQTVIPISHIGVMAEFQHNLEIWKQSEEESSVDVVDSGKISGNSKVSLLDIISANKNLKSKINKSDLNDKEAKCLLTMVRDYYMNHCDNKMSSKEMERIANEIEKYFPGEESKTYYKTSLLKQANGKFKAKDSGKLVSKWTNRTDKDEAKTKQLLNQCATNQTSAVDIPHIDNEDEQKRIQAALKNCSKKPLEMILKDWSMCRDIRLRCLLDNKDEGNILKIVTEWPPYLWPEGNILVSLTVLKCFHIIFVFAYRW